MKKTNKTKDLGDLSFTEQEVQQLQEAEQAELDRASASPTAQSNGDPEARLLWWDKWRKITAR